MLFANAALRTLRRKDSQAGYREFVEGLAAAAGVPTPTLAELAAFDRKRQGKTLSNQEWESPTDPDARVAKMKAGTTHLAHKAEYAVDLESGALVGVTLQAADQGDTATLEAVEAAQGEGPEQVVADKGYHSDGVLLGLEEAGQEAHIPEPQRAALDFEGKPEAERVVQGNRERVASPAGKRLQKLLLRVRNWRLSTRFSMTCSPNRKTISPTVAGRSPGSNSMGLPRATTVMPRSYPRLRTRVWRAWSPLESSPRGVER